MKQRISIQELKEDSTQTKGHGLLSFKHFPSFEHTAVTDVLVPTEKEN